MKKPLKWDPEKSKWLKAKRGVSFEDIKEIIESEGSLDTVPNKLKYRNQKIFVVNVKGYIYFVPFVEDSEKVFLKTLYPNRKATKKYLVERNEK